MVKWIVCTGTECSLWKVQPNVQAQRVASRSARASPATSSSQQDDSVAPPSAQIVQPLLSTLLLPSPLDTQDSTSMPSAAARILPLEEDEAVALNTRYDA
jgi:hypothetical protein